MITFSKVAPKTTISLILGVHYAHRMPCVQYAFGMFDGPFLVGCVTFGQPASPTVAISVGGGMHKENVLELNRLVLLPEYNGKNYASMLVSFALRQLPHPMYIVSYADTKQNHVGYIYQATNFIYAGKTVARLERRDGERHSRHHSKDAMLVPRSVKHRYVYILGSSKKERKAYLKDMKWNNEAYPKGDKK